MRDSVAGGKGGLRSALYLLGYRNVVTIDKRHHLARGRPGGAYRHLDWNNEPDNYDLIVGMHPDQATDHIILFAARVGKPALICPCCVMPSAVTYGGRAGDFRDWIGHLKSLAARYRRRCEHFAIPITGRNEVLYLP